MCDRFVRTGVSNGSRSIAETRMQRDNPSSRPTIDIVVPAFNEADNIGLLLEKLHDGLAGLPYAFEIVVVDDGSTDETASVAERCAGLFPVRVIRLTRNFGKEAALLAGLDAARGAATIIMDADLQHPVELVPAMLARWEQGFECVYAVQSERHESWLKRVATAAFYAGINRGADVAIPPNAGDFRLLDRAVVRALCSIRERVRFTKGLYAWLGFRSVGLPYVAADRHAGVTTFGAARLLGLAWDGITSFSDWPLRLSGFVGLATALLAIVYAVYIAVRTLVFGVDVPGWATLTDAIMLLGGLQILFLGVLGQYVRNMYLETKQRPNYLVREVVDAKAPAAASDKNAPSPRPEESTGQPVVSLPNRTAAA